MNRWHLLLLVVICVLATKKQEETRDGHLIHNDVEEEKRIIDEMKESLETRTLNINEIDAFLKEVVPQLTTLQATIPNELLTNHDTLKDRIMMIEKESMEQKSILEELQDLYDAEVQKTLSEVREYIKSTVFPALKENIRTKSVKLCESKYVSDDWYLKILSDELRTHKINIISEFSGKFSENRCLRFYW